MTPDEADLDYTVGRQIYYWRHLSRRMRDPRRMVSREEVDAVLRHHDVDVPSRQDPAARVLIGDVGDRRIQVVIRPHHTSVEVMTAMPVRRGRGRIRGTQG